MKYTVLPHGICLWRIQYHTAYIISYLENESLLIFLYYVFSKLMQNMRMQLWRERNDDFI
ncbi:hypothetical protein BRYFOR_05749 [Marvinbryantia formatexigens DSM 14469]|uniref:Uncharacterized protein n=1 Tax=Marvinbryantia formatexigens DSM 14469 TaxID=478749 RepID=C6LAV5_9FIRM|nr:hypothetical protein BRYFOR_05749 [Marvinbryantia formatexigens DSM 14469]